MRSKEIDDLFTYENLSKHKILKATTYDIDINILKIYIEHLEQCIETLEKQIEAPTPKTSDYINSLKEIQQIVGKTIGWPNIATC